jgi:hypothetical protein
VLSASLIRFRAIVPIRSTNHDQLRGSSPTLLRRARSTSPPAHDRRGGIDRLPARSCEIIEHEAVCIAGHGLAVIDVE